MKKEYIAEFLGTFWLVFGGCGSAVFAAFITVPGGGNTNVFGLGYLGVARYWYRVIKARKSYGVRV
jgi:aquaporin Z